MRVGEDPVDNGTSNDFLLRAKTRVRDALGHVAWTMQWGPGVERAPVAYPPGHYYSPLPACRDIAQPRHLEIVGIDLRCDAQLALLATLRVGTPSGPRYHTPDNGWFPSTDAAVYEAMIRLHQPKRVIEVGCGWSTAALFDAGAAPEVTLVEPFPDRVHQLLTAHDLAGCELLEVPLQAVPRSRFERLDSGDVLFIDSTHVAKCGSDVNRIFFEILPALAPGVIVHFHDIFYPFEYPDDWVREGRGWNEAYVLRAFLEYNDAFEILLWNHMLQTKGYLSGDCGSIWLRKVEHHSVRDGSSQASSR